MVGSLLGTSIARNSKGVRSARSFTSRNQGIPAFANHSIRRRFQPSSSSLSSSPPPSPPPSNFESISNVNDSTREKWQHLPTLKDGIIITPWNDPKLPERSNRAKEFRSRQHVNPLASKFQQPTVLSVNWPRDVFVDMSKPLFLDIGCSRGGFLLEMAKERPSEYNYLGLEIRPLVAHQARQRISRHQLQGRLDFIGCNVNVDLERLLTLAGADQNLQMVTIQFPDPHFKSRHAKRRVVTPELVTTLARFMPPGATVFLQSDVQSVLDEMRLQFRDRPDYFQDGKEGIDDYVEENIFGIPTEREVSVLERGLPVYRATFTRATAS